MMCSFKSGYLTRVVSSIFLLSVLLLRANAVTLTVDNSLVDASDAGGWNCAGLVNANDYSACGLRSAWEYCVNTTWWANSAASASENDCTILIAENSNLSLNGSLGPLSLLMQQQTHNFSVSISANGIGATITASQVFDLRVVNFFAEWDESIFTISNLAMVPLVTAYNQAGDDEYYLGDDDYGINFSGNAIIVDSIKTVTFNNVNVSGYYSFDYGPVYVKNSYNFTGSDMVFFNNSANREGGSLSIAYNSIASLYRTKISHSISNKFGGAVYFDTIAQYARLFDCVFEHNEAVYGGAVSVTSDVVLQIQRSEFNYNTAVDGSLYWGNGGAVYMAGGSVLEASGIVANNNRASFGGAFNLADQVRVVCDSCNFINNTALSSSVKGGGAIFQSVSTSFYGNDMLIEGNTASSGGGIYAEDGGKVTLVNSSVTNNIALASHGGGVYLVDGEMNVTNSILSGNVAWDNGGGMYLTIGSSVNIDVMTLYNNTAQTGDGGGMHAYSVYRLHSKGLTVDSNTARSGAGVYLGGEFLAFQDSIVSNNRALYFGGGMYFEKSYDVVISSFSFLFNNADFQGGGVYFAQFVGPVVVEDCSFLNNSAVYGGGLVINQFVTNLKLKTSYFVGNVARMSGGGIYIESKNEYNSIESTAFRSNLAVGGDGGAIYIGTSNSRISLIGDSFLDNMAKSGFGGSIQVNSLNDQVYVSNCSFSSNKAIRGGGLNSGVENQLELRNNSFLNNSAIGGYGGGVHLGSSHSGFILTLCDFAGNRATRGGALYVGDESATSTAGTLSGTESNNHDFAGNTFVNNAADVGGAVLLARVYNANIENCTFIANSVVSNANSDFRQQVLSSSSVNDDYSGGAVALLTWSQNISFHNCSMTNNAAVAGSVLHSNSAVHVTLSNCTLRNNVAATYGTIYWAYDSTHEHREPIAYSVIISNNTHANNTLVTLDTLLGTQGLKLHAYGVDTPDSDEITIVDYTQNPQIRVDILDFYGSPKYFDYGTSISASVNGSMDGCLSQGTGSIAGMTAATSENGFVQFGDMSLSCYPSGALQLQFSSFPLSSSSLSVVFSQCRDGYVLVNFECIKCDAGQYSLDYSTDATCLAAPQYTDKTHTFADNIFVNTGYWRINNDTTTVMACPYGTQACNGGYATGASSCNVGYEGPLCGVCSDDYYPSTTGSVTECLGCDSSGSLVLMLLPAIIIFFLLTIAVIFAVFYYKLDTQRLRGVMTLFGLEIAEGDIEEGDVGDEQAGDLNSDGTSEGLSYFDSFMGKLKILVSSYQIVSGFPSTLNVKFPAAATRLFSVFSFINLISLDVPSAACFSKVDYVDTLLMTTLAPIIVAIILLLCFMGESLRLQYNSDDKLTEEIKKSRQSDLENRYFTLFLLVTYIVLPSVSSTIAHAYDCTDVDPNDVDPGQDGYLTVDLSISCSSSRYNFGVAWATIMLFVYPLGIPALYFYLLYQHKSDITSRQNEDFVVRNPQYKSLDFLFKSYEPQFWYWEVVETARRLFFTFLLEFGAVSQNIQIVASILMAVLFMKLYAFFEPYEEDMADVLQEMAQYQVFLTLFGALLLDTEALGGSSTSKLVISVCLVIVNSAASWTFFYFQVTPFVDDIKTFYETYGKVDGDDSKDKGACSDVPAVKDAGENAGVMVTKKEIDGDIELSLNTSDYNI